VHERHRGLGALVAQVRVEGRQLIADQHALVVERARGAGGDVQAGLLGGQLAYATDHIELALKRVLVARLGRTGADEQLPDHRAARARDLTGVLLAHRYITPPQHQLALGRNGALHEALQPRACGGVGRQEAHQHAVAAARRQLETHLRPQQLVGHLHQDPRPVARVRVRARRAPVLEVLERGDRERDHLVRGDVVQPRDHAHPARVVLEARVVQSDGRWRLLGVRSHVSAHLGRRIPAAWVHPEGHTHPGAGRRAPEAEPESVAAKKAAKPAVQCLIERARAPPSRVAPAASLRRSKSTAQSAPGRSRTGRDAAAR